MEGALEAEALLPGAHGAEVLCGLLYHIGPQLRRNNSHDGSFDPAHITHRRLVEHGLATSDSVKMYERLDQLLPHGGLRPWIDRHASFQYTNDGKEGMIVTCVREHSPAFGSATQEEQPQQGSPSTDPGERLGTRDLPIKKWEIDE